MKYFAYCALIVVLFCCGKCSSDNGYLSRLYRKGYVSIVPLGEKTEPVKSVLIGAYLLNSERALIITKADDKTYSFNFLSNNLSDQDLVYSGHCTTLKKNTFVNLLTNIDNKYLFFLLKTEDRLPSLYLLTEGVKDQMMTRTINGVERQELLSEWIKRQNTFYDTSSFLEPVMMGRITDAEAYAFQKARLKEDVDNLTEYALYESKYPADAGLPELKTEALQKTIANTGSMSTLRDLYEEYPAEKERIITRAKKSCVSTYSCMDFIKYFPEASGRDSVVEVAFSTAKSQSDYKSLIKAFADDKRSVKLMVKLYQEGKLKEDRYTSDEEITSGTLYKEMINTFKVYENLPFAGVRFYKNSFLLLPEGKQSLDDIATFLKTNNEKGFIQDIYITTHNMVVEKGTQDEVAINFKLSLNRLVTIRNYIQSKGITNVNFHYIPCGSTMPGFGNEQVQFLLSEEQAATWKKIFTEIVQTSTVPDAFNECKAIAYIRETELENYLCSIFKQAGANGNKIVPPNFWDEQYTSLQPDFTEVKTRMETSAKENRISKKKYKEMLVQ